MTCESGIDCCFCCFLITDLTNKHDIGILTIQRMGRQAGDQAKGAVGRKHPAPGIGDQQAGGGGFKHHTGLA